MVNFFLTFSLIRQVYKLLRKQMTTCFKNSFIVINAQSMKGKV